ncbi:FAD-dependent oxidoreductase [Shewanella psychropiezotolerans]|uniref:FAD-dependent oxidoreductase n=1 Tax=Shewanella psychropiezotolerans TaxID=2593655 RepID=A0ABX5WYA2_9GAMM|nr:FAD-dependent oxidoreductase [Shewanella psychropiezotolerans]
MQHYDVVIVGAGVAGMAISAVLARQGLSVVLVDRGQAEGISTGECLMADALPIMARLGLDTDFIAANHIALQSYRVSWGNSNPMNVTLCPVLPDRGGSSTVINLIACYWHNVITIKSGCIGKPHWIMCTGKQMTTGC